MGRSYTPKTTKEVSRWSIGSLLKSTHGWRSLLVFLIFTVLSILMTWPLATQLGTHIPGEGWDQFAHIWTYSWVKEALFNGKYPFYTTLLYYPEFRISLVILSNTAWRTDNINRCFSAHDSLRKSIREMILHQTGA